MFDLYARLSWNPNTRELEKIEDQWADNATVIDRMGGALGELLSDGLSAWKRGCVGRGGSGCWSGWSPASPEERADALMAGITIASLAMPARNRETAPLDLDATDGFPVCFVMPR
ncbi:MAG: hypothetical protein GEV28_07650 [Actinophytocola sp.]|uniref:hypothetical protein n=1 Tax=Actinophytocola sp. TaxID=1872138 RepID=UPI001323C0BC|nr:hypothetical protein [Actinophytocola sp.]MPZ80264.1 hypothetical protein [Actinophytocola sp.]